MLNVSWNQSCGPGWLQARHLPWEREVASFCSFLTWASPLPFCPCRRLASSRVPCSSTVGKVGKAREWAGERLSLSGLELSGAGLASWLWWFLKSILSSGELCGLSGGLLSPGCPQQSFTQYLSLVAPWSGVWLAPWGLLVGSWFSVYYHTGFLVRISLPLQVAQGPPRKAQVNFLLLYITHPLERHIFDL